MATINARAEPQRPPHAADLDRRAGGEQAAPPGKPARRALDPAVDLADQLAVQAVVMTAGDAAQHLE